MARSWVRRPRLAVCSLLCALVALGAGPRGGHGPDAARAMRPPADGEVGIAADRTTHRVGEPVLATLTNRGTGTILSGGHLCGDVGLEREDGDAWVTVPAQTGLCPFQVVLVHAGATRTETLQPLSEPGVYRVVLRYVSPPRYDEPREIPSEPFLVTP